MEENLLVVLFDIDGTLIDGHNYWKKLLFEATNKVTRGNIDIDEIEITGKTDITIMREICKASNYNFEEAETLIINNYLENFDNPEISNHYQILPNVESTLIALRSKGIELGIVTGNRRKSGIRKLGLKGIDTFFNLEISCFSAGSETREELLQVSLKKIEEKFNPSQVYYVADTPNDISSANKVGMLSVAVATSEVISTKALKNARPYLFLNSLSESKRLFDVLFKE